MTKHTPGPWSVNFGRCGRVFKEKATGRVYDIDGRVFRDATGCFTNSESRVEVTFPYVPKTEIVDIA